MMPTLLKEAVHKEEQEEVAKQNPRDWTNENSQIIY